MLKQLVLFVFEVIQEKIKIFYQKQTDINK